MNRDQASDDLPPVSACVDMNDAQPVSNPDVPGHIGPFRVLGVLGRGGFGIVYRAEQELPRREVAVKVLHRGSVTSERIARLREEAELLARMRHPGIAQVYQVGEADTPSGRQAYLAMELVDGARLDRFASDKQLDFRARLRLLADVCDSVQHAHQKGVIHRDLKPSNILVDADGRPKILDFGLARPNVSDSPTQTGAVVGTPVYMSPEQTGGNPDDIDVRSDVYALGVIAYESLAGRRPFETTGKSLSELLQAIREQTPVPVWKANPTCPVDAGLIAAKAMARDRMDRYATASEMATDIRRLLAGYPVTARKPSARYHALLFAKRNAGLVAAGAAALIFLVSGLIVTSVLYVRAIAAEKEVELRRVAEAEDARVHLRQSHLQRAELAMQRGAWRAALEAYDSAAEDAQYTLTASDHLNRIRALNGLNKARNVTDEIDLLRSIPQLTERERALADLWYAYSCLLGMGPEDDADEVLQGVIKRELPDAEHEFALGLNAKSTADAVQHLSRAIEADDRLQPAWSYLGFLLLMRGEFDNAAIKFTAGELFFPDDPSFKMLRALHGAIKNDEEIVEAAMHELERLLVDEDLKLFRDVVKAFGILAHADELTQVQVPNAIAKFTPAISIMLRGRAISHPHDEPNPLLRLMPRNIIMTPFIAIQKNNLALQLGFNRSQAIENLSAEAKTHPDGLLFAMLGKLHEDAGQLRDAAHAYQEAARTPSLTPVKRQSLVLASGCELLEMRAALAAGDQATSDEYRSKAKATVREVAPLFASRPLKATDLGFVGTVVNVAWQTDELQVARTLLEHWEESDSTNAEMARLRVGVEFNGGAYGLALEWCKTTVERDPKFRDEMDGVAKTLKEKLREEADRLAPVMAK